MKRKSYLKMKSNKGITLIALVITIVVLIILATVSINMILNEDGGIIGAAEKSKELYQNAAAKEQTDLAGIEELLGSYEEKWVYDSEKQTVTKGDVTLEIGQKIEYNEGTGHTTTPDTTKGIGGIDNMTGALVSKTYANENLEWRVLGVNESGELELVSTHSTISDMLYIYGKEGYLNAETKNGVTGTLDTFCYDLYGKGTGAKSARSLNMNDINKLTGFNPETDYEGYNTDYIYKYYNGTVKYTTDLNKDMNQWEDTGSATITTPNWKIDSSNVGPETLKTTYYTYQITGESINKIDIDWYGVPFYLGSTYSNLSVCGIFAIMPLPDSDTQDIVHWSCFNYSTAKDTGTPVYVMPVVTLKSDAVLEDTDNNDILNVK